MTAANAPVRGTPDTSGSRRREAVFAACVTLAHLALAIYAIAHHEMWRDEVHSWLVARDAATPWDVVRGHAYDGHPPLWYLVLWVLQRVTSRVEAMQAVHVGIAGANVFVFARHAPFPRLPRALFAFGYFALYEYAAISRCYGLALLFALLLCVNHRRRFARPWVTAALLSALALTTTVSTITAAAYAAALALEIVRARRGKDPGPTPPTGASLPRAWIPVVACGVAFAFAAWCAFPPVDSTVARVGDLPGLGWDYAPTRLVVALVPVPRPDFFFWNSNALLASPTLWRIAVPLAALLAAWIVWCLSRAVTAAVLFGAGALGLMSLFGLVYSGDVRHHGFLFVLFLMGAWIAQTAGADGGGRRARALRFTVTLVLAAQLPGTVIAVAYDRRYVFSSGRRAAAAIRARGLEDEPLVGEVDYAATAVIGHLGPRAMGLSPRNGKPFSYVRWTGDRARAPDDAEIVRFAARVGSERGRDAVLLMNRPLAGALVDGARVERLDELYDSMIEEENFYLYRVTRTK